MSRETVEMVRRGIRPLGDTSGQVSFDDVERSHMSARYVDELERKIEYLKAYNDKYGEQPSDEDTDEVATLRRLLTKARKQRDATQAALDKANRDNDALRAALRKEKARADDLDELYRAADRAINRIIGENEARALVDGAAVYEVEDEAE
jgi:chromosome segregation ATPase